MEAGKKQAETLQEQIDIRKGEITTDGYPMSIGELSSLYKEKELDIHPEFQRFFRWSMVQKSKLIESILLGIPIPSIFVAQREDGVWDVVDGLQRLSTIFEFMGILKKENGFAVPASRLEGTKYLPLLQGKIWESELEAEKNNTFTTAQRLALKREKIDVKIVKKESHDSFKFELFQRLNTLGSKLSDQEVRNCLLVLINLKFYKWVRDLASYEPYLQTLSLTEKLLEEQYNMELAVRFIVFNSLDVNSLVGEVRKASDLSEYITDKISVMAEQSKFEGFDYQAIEAKFKKTFSILSGALGEDSFKKYNFIKGTFSGGFLISAYEVIAMGIGHNADTYPDDITEIIKSTISDKIKGIWNNPTYTTNSGSGFKAAQRIPHIIPLGVNTFKNED